MKKIAQAVVLHSLSLYLVSLIFEGLKISGRFESYLVAGLFLTVGNYILKPVLQIIAIPFQLVTLGLFSLVINAFILYITAVLYPNIKITAFNFSGISLGGVAIPAFQVNTILSYLIISATIYFLIKFLTWFFS